MAIIKIKRSKGYPVEKSPIKMVSSFKSVDPKTPKNFCLKNISLSILAGLIAAGLFTSVLYVSATPPGSPYNPGEILNPSCAPGDTNCSVVPPANYSFGSNNFSGTGDFNTTGGTITASTFKVGSIYTFPTADGVTGQALTTNDWELFHGQQ